MLVCIWCLHIGLWDGRSFEMSFSTSPLVDIFSYQLCSARFLEHTCHLTVILASISFNLFHLNLSIHLFAQSSTFCYILIMELICFLSLSCICQLCRSLLGLVNLIAVKEDTITTVVIIIDYW